MSNIIPTSSITGIVIFVSLYFLSVLVYINFKKYDWFFIPFLVGIFMIIFIFINNISKIAKLKQVDIINKNKLNKVKTCPEYWIKYNSSNTSEPNTMCSSKNIYDNVSISTIVKTNDEDKDTPWKSVDYKQINLTDINKQTTNEKICERMFRYYTYTSDLDIDKKDITADYNAENKSKVTWIEYQNNCLKNT